MDTAGAEGKGKEEALAREIEKVKREYEEKQQRKKEKEKEKKGEESKEKDGEEKKDADKDKGKDKDAKSDEKQRDDKVLSPCFCSLDEGQLTDTDRVSQEAREGTGKRTNRRLRLTPCILSAQVRQPAGYEYN